MFSVNCEIFSFCHPVYPVFKELEQEREKRRYERQGEFVKKMMQEKFLAKGLTLKKARDIIWAFSGRASDTTICFP